MYNIYESVVSQTVQSHPTFKGKNLWPHIWQTSEHCSSQNKRTQSNNLITRYITPSPFYRRGFSFVFFY